MKFNFIEKSCNNHQVNRWRRSKKNSLAHILTVCRHVSVLSSFFYDDHLSKTYAAFCTPCSSLVNIQCVAIGKRFYNSFTLWIPALWYFIKCVLILQLDVVTFVDRTESWILSSSDQLNVTWFRGQNGDFDGVTGSARAHTFIQEAFTIHILSPSTSWSSSPSFDIFKFNDFHR